MFWYFTSGRYLCKASVMYSDPSLSTYDFKENPNPDNWNVPTNVTKLCKDVVGMEDGWLEGRFVGVLVGSEVG